MNRIDNNTYEIEISDVKDLVKERNINSNKGDFGKIGILGGSLKYSGAVKLAAMSLSALRSGCGLARVIVPKKIIQSVSPYLLEQTIVNSDNTALNILVHSMGYKKCKEELTKYSDVEIAEEFYSSNIANVSYYYNVLQHLYENSDKYSELIEYMKISSGGEYLKANLPQYEVAHKYGSYDGYIHDYGIIYGENTYLIGVFTNGIANASHLIAEIGKQVVTCAKTEGIEETSDETESNTNSISIIETNTGNVSDIQESNAENTPDVSE